MESVLLCSEEKGFGVLFGKYNGMVEVVEEKRLGG